MKYKVLVVDDSDFFRRWLVGSFASEPRIEVIGEAKNGREAVTMAKELKPDVITMDVEMPEMNGINAVREIMNSQPIPILMFSSLTRQGAHATLDALAVGAADFLPKNLSDLGIQRSRAREVICERVLALAGGQHDAIGRIGEYVRAEKAPKIPVVDVAPRSSAGNKYRLLIVGSSTGGPNALVSLLTDLPASFPLPIVLVQHMPATFTHAFAERLNSQCKIKVQEASEGQLLQAGNAYLAPGGKELTLAGNRNGARIRIGDAKESSPYHPSVDIAFTTAGTVFPNAVMALVLTGMGSDGCEGARSLKSQGATVWAQDQESSLIYGMPAAVAKAGLADKIMSLNKIAANLQSLKFDR